MQIPFTSKKKSPPSESIKRLNSFLGLNVSVTNTQIKDSESPDMLNMTLDDRGALNKRFGYKRVVSIGAGKINGLFVYQKSTGDIYLVAHGTKLYSWTTAGVFTEIYDGLANVDIHGFYHNDKFYLLDGVKYRVYDGASVTEVVGYVPTVNIGVPPAGGGTVYEQLNLLSPGFKTRFTGDGTAVAYQLPLTGLDATEIVVKVGGVTKTKTTDYSWNATTGIVTFVVAPPDAVDNVEVTAYKTFTGYRAKVEKCRIWTSFGGANDTRIFISGNPDEPNTDWHSGLQDPTYFPANGFASLGHDDEKITGYVKQYNSLIVIKEHSQYLRTEYMDTSTGSTQTEPTYPVKRFNDGVGSVEFDQVQLIENTPIVIDTKGVYLTVATSIADERNVKHISNDVDTNANYLSTVGILDSGELTDYKTVDHEQKFMMFNKVTGVVWVYDYRFGKWYKWDNLFANCFVSIDGELYYGDSLSGNINKLKTINDVFPYRDHDGSINAYWRSKVFDFDNPTYTKMVNKVFFTIKPSVKTSAKLSIRTDKDSSFEEIETKVLTSFTYSSWVYSTFSYVGQIFPVTTRSKIKAKKVGYLQLELANNVIDESLGILSIEMTYRYQSEQK